MKILFFLVLLHFASFILSLDEWNGRLFYINEKTVQFLVDGTCSSSFQVYTYRLITSVMSIALSCLSYVCMEQCCWDSTCTPHARPNLAHSSVSWSVENIWLKYEHLSVYLSSCLLIPPQHLFNSFSCIGSECGWKMWHLQNQNYLDIRSTIFLNSETTCVYW